MFHNSKLPDSVWQKLDDSLKKIQDICLGKELCRILLDSLKGKTLYIKTENISNCLFGPIENVANDEYGIKLPTGQVLGIILGEKYESNNLLHELMHVHRYYTEENNNTYNKSTLNGEIEAQYTQVLYKNKKGIKINDPIDQRYEYRKAIKNLNLIIDDHGNLKSGTTEDDLEGQTKIILDLFKLSPIYSNPKYKYDSTRNTLSNFNNLRAITNECP